jgi:lactate permease
MGSPGVADRQLEGGRRVWTQSYDPVGNVLASALVAALPVAFLFWALTVQRMRGHTAGLSTVGVAVVVAVAAYHMPLRLAVASTVQGALYGLFPIGWIVVAAVFLYRITVDTGQFDLIKNSIAAITDDRRLQALLIAFGFGAFLEGAAGFGTPVAISAAMLVGLGFEPHQAAGLCLIANTAPVAFGAIGTPVVVAGQVTGIDDRLISQMVGRQLPLLSMIVPFWLVFTMSGRRGVREVWPAALVCGGSFALAQWWTANYLGPLLPDVVSSLCSILCLVLFLRVWTPPTVFRFDGERPPAVAEPLSPWRVFRAWSPFVVLTIIVGDWGIRPVKAILERATLSVPFPCIHNAVTVPGEARPLAAVFSFNWLSATGTAILLAALVAVAITGMSPRRAARVFGRTLKSLAAPLVTVAAVLGFAYIGNSSGMTTAMGMALASTGGMFPLFSPVLG